MRVTRRDVRQPLENSFDDRRFVLAEGLGGNERAHVEEAVRLAGGVAVNDREVRSNRLGGIEGDREGEEQAAGGGFEGGLRGRQMLIEQVFERALAVAQRLGHVRAYFAGAIPGVELSHPCQGIRDARQDSVELRIHWFTCTTRAGGKPLNDVLLAAEYAPMFWA